MADANDAARCVCGAPVAAHRGRGGRQLACEAARRAAGLQQPLGRLHRTPVASSSIRALAFELSGASQLGYMEVEFHDGNVFAYDGVRVGVYLTITSGGQAGSIGQTFHGFERFGALGKGRKL
jgi:hypothetical protein